MRRALGAAAVAACLLGVGGCSSGEADAAPSPTSSSSTPSETPSASPSPTAVAPTMPPEAAERTAAGAEAFARFYFDAVNYAFATGDVSIVERHSLPACTSCASTIEYVREPYDNQDRWQDVAIIVHDVAAPPLDARGAIVALALEQSEGARISADGEHRPEPGVPPYSANMYAEWQNDAWAFFVLANVEYELLMYLSVIA